MEEWKHRAEGGNPFAGRGKSTVGARRKRAKERTQEGVAKEGLKTILGLLGQGRAVLVFPEGERTVTGQMSPLKPGVQLLIKRTRAPVIPVGIAAVGLAQNFAALRALATEGIQRGHMSLHARNIAATVGATGEEVDRVAEILVKERKIRMDRAKEVLSEFRTKKSK